MSAPCITALHSIVFIDSGFPSGIQLPNSVKNRPLLSLRAIPLTDENILGMMYWVETKTKNRIGRFKIEINEFNEASLEHR